jgi:hypothetical protein
MRVVTINVGTKYPDIYVERMFRMCAKHLPTFERFTCYTDRTRHVPAEVEQIDCSRWGLEGWWNKIRLFDREVLDEPFLFMDLDQIILRSLDPLVTYAQQRTDFPIFGMTDFLYDSFGSTVLFVRPCDQTQLLWDSFARGERYEAPDRLSGDQEFIEGCLRAHGLSDSLALFPDEWFLSYKVLRKQARGQSQRAQTQLERALFLVFHGRPKPHELLQPGKMLFFLLRHKPLRVFRYWRFLEDEVRKLWCLEGTA